PIRECRSHLFPTDYQVVTRFNAWSGDSTMCPNCLTNIAMALGGAGSAVFLAAAGLRFRTVRAPELTQPNTEETPS
ncbi:MAG TPA: hypothetical protein VFO71_06190, partial [Gemmatimonadales bacterium]|nr:hypothetical protein [Gemmatimonadales bacterium]